MAGEPAPAGGRSTRLQFAAAGESGLDGGPESGTPLALSGWLLPASEGRVRVLSEDLCLDFALESVLRIELKDPAWPTREVPRAATVELAPRPTVLANGPAGPWRDLFPTGPRPFALAARPSKASVAGHKEYLEREAAHLRAHSLEPVPARV